MWRKWFQIKLSGILRATFCMSICVAAWMLDYKPADQIPLLFLSIVAVKVLMPFVAIGVLFGRPWTGLIVGIALVGAYVAVWSAAVHHGLIQFP